MRRCNRCNEDKPLEEYAEGKTYKGGRRLTCKDCMNRSQRVSGWRGPGARLPLEVRRSIGL